MGLRVRQGGCVVITQARWSPVSTGDSHRQILAQKVAGGEHDCGRPAFFRHLAARGLSVVWLVASHVNRGLVDAIGATFLGAG
ncbi:transposase [Geodermatophilus sp. SYSU D00703]